MVGDILLHSPDHFLLFHICTDVSDYQLCPVIFQQNIPIAFNSHVLPPLHQW